MYELPMLAVIKQGVSVMFFTVFSAVIWWVYIRRGNDRLEQHRFDVLREEE